MLCAAPVFTNLQPARVPVSEKGGGGRKAADKGSQCLRHRHPLLPLGRLSPPPPLLYDARSSDTIPLPRWNNRRSPLYVIASQALGDVTPQKKKGNARGRPGRAVRRESGGTEGELLAGGGRGRYKNKGPSLEGGPRSSYLLTRGFPSTFSGAPYSPPGNGSPLSPPPYFCHQNRSRLTLLSHPPPSRTSLLFSPPSFPPLTHCQIWSSFTAGYRIVRPGAGLAFLPNTDPSCTGYPSSLHSSWCRTRVPRTRTTSPLSAAVDCNCARACLLLNPTSGYCLGRFLSATFINQLTI